MAEQEEIVAARQHQVLTAHAPKNMAHHLGRFANMVDSYSSVQCTCQPDDADFMAVPQYVEHLDTMLRNSR